MSKVAGDKPWQVLAPDKLFRQLPECSNGANLWWMYFSAASVKSAEFIGEEPVGTMLHALILLMEIRLEATKAFHMLFPEKVCWLSLIDTIHGEKFGALVVAHALGKDLFAVRLSTPSSRRGKFFKDY